MVNSSSSKYVKRRRHAKKYTIKKAMRGCSSSQSGGADNNVEVHIPQNAGKLGGTDNITNASANLLKLQATATAQGGNPAPYTSTSTLNFTATKPQQGGYKSKHRRRHYKKSIGRKGRSRRFRGSRK